MSLTKRNRRFVRGTHVRQLRLEPLEDRRMLATLIVNSVHDNVTSGDGLVTLREAIVAANNDTVTDLGLAGFGVDTILFATNVFDTPKTLFLALGELELTEAATIEGSGQELLTIDALQRSRIFNITTTTGDFTFSGLTLTGGLTQGDNDINDFFDTTYDGGAIRSLSTSILTIDQSTVSGNSTTGYSADGGGISAKGGVMLTGSTVSGNSTAGSGAGGGGIETFFGGGGVTLTNSAVSGNSASGSGGGILSRGSVTLTNSTVSGNSSAAGSIGGGGIAGFGYGSIVTLTDSTVSGNSASSQGGGISARDVTLINSTVSGNSTTGDFARGGGIYSDFNITLINSTVSANSATGSNAGGGGIFSFSFNAPYSHDVTLTGSTVSGNSTSGTGGGIWIESSDAIIVSNSIVAGNTAGGGMNDIDPNLASLDVNFSLIQQTGLPLVGGGNITGVSANLGPLADNAGLTQTHALLPGSPAIDAGGTTNLVNDQRGAPFVRVFDDPMAPGTGLDMGAYERQTLPGLSLVVDTPVDENDADYTAGDLSLREAVDLTRGSVGPGTITFDAAVFATPQTILLELGEINLSQAITIEGPGQQLLTIDAQQQSRIFNITAFSGDFTISGLSLTGGRTTPSPLSGRGGAIRSLTFDNLTINQSTVSGNSTTGDQADGGGISALGPVMLTGSMVSGNSTSGYKAKGGGIQSSGSVTLTDSTVSGNSTTGALADGGGIYSVGNVTLIGSTVSGNSTVGLDSAGGGILSRNSVMLTRSTVSGNSTAGSEYAGGGGIYAVGAVTLTQSTVSGNSTAGNYAVGGGILSYGPITLTYSTVTANHADHADASGGGIWNFDDPITITNSIVAGNLATGGMDDIDPGTGSFNVNFSLIEQTGLTITGSDNIIGMPANLGPLTGNGGPTKTHALLAGSLAIDAGDPSVLFNPAEFDQRGSPFVRVFDGDAIGGARIDMGAYERQSVAGLNLVVDTTVDESDGDFTAGDLSLREAVGIASGSAGPGTITFDAAVFATPQTILLSLGEIDISEALTIDGPGEQFLTIDAQQNSRIFHITATTGDFTLAGLTLTGGQTIASSLLGRGGAIRSLTTGSLTIDQSTVSDNSTTGFNAAGGGIDAIGAVTLTLSTVSDNSTAGDFASGGGIRSDGDVTLTRSTVSGNSTAGPAAQGGGIRSSGNTTLTQSTVSGNSTEGSSATGGGISSGGTATLTGSTVSGNSTTGSSANGGGITSGGDVTLNYSTISDNSSTGFNAKGGGIDNFDDSITITGSIVAGNMASGGMNDINPGTGTLDVNFSLIQQTGLTITGSDNIIGVPANLGLLASNGGPTETHALLPGSPAIDAGGTTTLVNDQRGAPFVRVFDDPTAAGTGLDMGAYERQTLPGLSLVVDTPVDENDADTTAGDLSLREAVDLARGSVGADTITFDAAVFNTPQTILLGLGEIEISEAVTIEGPGQQLLTIDAQQNSRIFNITATTGDITLAGLSLTGGRTIVDSTFSDSTGRGGAIRSLTAGSLTIDHSTVSGNSTAGEFADGGGIYSIGAVTLTQSTVSGNSATGDFSDGGGISSNGSVTLTQSTVSGNSTAGIFARGGGIRSGTVTLTDSTVSGNSTLGESSRGGGIYSVGNVTLIGSTVSGNSTAGDDADGGGIFSFFGAATLTSSTVSGNSTAGNDARSGGIFSFGPVALTYSTVTGNHADHATVTGGGIWNYDNPITITNSIVAGNTAAGGMNDIDPGTGSLNVDFSLIGDTTGLTIVGSGNITGLPANLGLLADNGGPTETHSLLPASPAIDAGDPTAMAGVGGVPMFDQRGMPFGRVEDGDSNMVARIDMGAYEVQPPTPTCDFDGMNGCNIDDIDAMVMEIVAGTNSPLYDLTDDGLVNLADRDQWLTDAGALNLTSGNPYLLGDSNLDGVVDGQDFLVWNANKFMSTGKWSQADWNADGVTDGQDFIIWNGNKFQSSDGLLRSVLPSASHPSYEIAIAPTVDLQTREQSTTRLLGISQIIPSTNTKRIDAVFAGYHQREERVAEQRQADIFDALIEDFPMKSYLL